jgi:cholesterol transport system auxiliary component
MNNFLTSTLPTRRIFLVGGASTVLVAGCGSLIGPSNAPPQIYVLTPDLHALPDVAKVSWPLSVARPDASEILSTARIALRRGDTMDYFADVRWDDNAPRLVQARLVEAFEKSGGIDAVADDGVGIRADYVLESELRAFEAHYHDENGAPTVIVDIVAKLVAAHHREIAAVHEARQESPASANSVAAVVTAFDAATSLVLEDIVAWALAAGSAAASAVAAKPAEVH